MKKSRMKRIRLLVAVLAMLIAATGLAEPFQTTAGGMKIKDLKKGTGQTAEVGQIATIQFKGWIDEGGARGREIYNTRNRGEPVTFVIGTTGVMPAWNEGVIGMQPGGKRLLLVPPGMAYGRRAIADVVPANSALVFHIELIRLEPAAD